MSWWVYLNDPVIGRIVDLPERHEEGGTFALGGTTEACVNITYNYGRVWRVHDFELESLEGKSGEQTLGELERVIAALGSVEPSEDYWAPTPGNAGRALFVLARWARDRPDGIWHIS